MDNLLRVCLYNSSPDSAPELTKPIRELNFVRFVGEVRSLEKLTEMVKEHGVNLIFFHLNPDPKEIVQVIEEVASRSPELALIAIGDQADPTSILAPMRAGCDQFVCKPIDPEDLASAVTRVASKRLFHQPKSRCICVTPASGGAGATSIACNLALEIAHLTDRNCALVDLDLQFGDVALNFDCQPKYTFQDLVSVGDELDRSALESATKRLSCKVNLLARPQTVEQIEDGHADTTHRILELLISEYENIVIDVPRHIDTTTCTAFGHAEIILLVCQLSVPSIHNAKRYLESLVCRGIPDDRIEVVVNRGDSRSQRVSENDITETLNKEVFWTIPNDYEFVARSIDLGRPVAALDSNNPVRTAIRAMAKKITASGSDDGSKQRRGLFSRLLSR